MIQILDTHNLYHTTRAKYGDFKVDYSKVFKHRSIAIILESQSFENLLRFQGYEIVVSEPEACLMHVLAEVIRVRDPYVLLGTQDPNIVPIVRALRGRGVYVEILGVGISRELRNACNKWTEVTEEILCPA